MKKNRFIKSPKVVFSIYTIAITGMLSAMSAVLQVFDFPILGVFPEFLKLDFSDYPALIASFAIGVVPGIAVELIKNLIHLLFTKSAGVGELANFLIGAAFVVPSGLIYARKRTKHGALLGMVVGTVSMTVIGIIANYFILIPFYSKIMPISAIIDMGKNIIPAVNSVFSLVIYCVAPFNIFKGCVISVVTFLTYKHIPHLLKKRM